jgi:hypothetical protein
MRLWLVPPSMTPSKSRAAACRSVAAPKEGARYLRVHDGLGTRASENVMLRAAVPTGSTGCGASGIFLQAPSHHPASHHRRPAQWHSSVHSERDKKPLRQHGSVWPHHRACQQLVCHRGAQCIVLNPFVRKGVRPDRFRCVDGALLAQFSIRLRQPHLSEPGSAYGRLQCP